MTISTSPSDPLFVVIGATGLQGGSVVHAIQASKQAYRVRFVTRDASKATAKELQKLGPVVEADVSDVSSLKSAFEGASIVFACTVTDYFAKNATEKEFPEGKNQVDAALEAGVQKFAYSGLMNMDELSNGRNKVWSFDRKNDVVKYARSKSSSWDVYDVQPGCYASNFLTGIAPRPSPANDGTYVISATVAPDTLVPIVDIPTDYGKYVLGAVEKGVHDVYTGIYMTMVEVAEDFSKFSGKKVTYTQIPDEVLYSIASKAVNEVCAEAWVAMYKAVREVGYYAHKDLKESVDTMIDGPPATLTEFLQRHKEQVQKFFA
ncbi:hypothetical protein ONZ45_g19696 [Pleurotus djamor]|nr:hypothetical protein ONZ45_g19696 [Pleurotus djamor]